jgi:hypothetical protein
MHVHCMCAYVTGTDMPCRYHHGMLGFIYECIHTHTCAQAIECISGGTWAAYAMESLELGRDEPYLTLNHVVHVTKLTKPGALL